MNIAYIPVRGGSKTIPLKNIRLINGEPLVYWVIKAANECSFIEKVYVSSDSTEIREIVESFPFKKLITVSRSASSATDTASTESAMIEFANNYSFENIVLIQATSPLLTSKDLEHGFRVYNSEGTDSVLSVVRQKRFIWEGNPGVNIKPVNYDFLNRPRRQDFEGFLVENGAFYITSRKKLLTTKCRISGNIKAVEMDEMSYFEIDTETDWKIVETLMNYTKSEIK